MLFLSGITEFVFIKVAKNFKNKTSIDVNGISIEILKHLIPNVVKPLAYICNRSFLDGCFSDGMKISKVVQVYNGGKSELNNCRPISILPQLLERLLEKHC